MAAALTGIGWGVGFAIFGAVLVGIEAVWVSGVPRESAEVVRISTIDDPFACGGRYRNDGQADVVVFEVVDPRPGFPTTFEVQVCPDSYAIGEQVVIARRRTDEEPTVDPPAAWEVPVFAAALGGAIGVGALAYRLVTGGAVAWIREEKAARRRKPDLSSREWLGPTDGP